MRNAQIIDIEEEPAEVRRLRRRLALRIAVSFAGILLILGGLVGSAVLTREMNERDLLAFSGEFMRVLDDRITSEVRAYLAPARDSVHYLAAAMPQRPLSESGRARFERMAADILARHPQIAILYLGTTAGEFLLVTRNETGSVDSKVITIRGGTRNVVWYRRDAEGNIDAMERAPDDPYDPRTRNWFKGALAGAGVFWTDVYVFYTDKVPGITAAKTVDGPADGTSIVVGADIYLSQLGNFLSGLQSKARGDLAIVDSDGRFVAYSEPAQIFTTENDGPRLTTIREIGKPALSEAFDRVRVFGEGQRLIEIDGTGYLLAAASLSGMVGRNWQLLMLAPASEYSGFVAVNSGRGLLTTGIIIAFAFILASVHSYQMYAAERNVRRLRRREAAYTKQADAFETISSLPGLAQPGDNDTLLRALGILATAANARRASIWQLSSRGTELVLLENAGADVRDLPDGAVLHAGDLAGFFEDLRAGRTTTLERGMRGREEAEPDPEYLKASGADAIVGIPVFSGEDVIGAVWLEYEDTATAHRTNLALPQAFASLIAPRVVWIRDRETIDVNHGRSRFSAASAGQSRDTGRNLLSDIRVKKFENSLHGNIGEAIAISPSATVMALTFLDDRLVAAALPDSEDGAMISRIVDSLRRAAQQAGVPYLKTLAGQFIAVDGLEDDDKEAAANRILELALAMQEVCSTLYMKLGRQPMYALGVDTGPVIGMHVGFGKSPCNFWGEAVKLAIAMAGSAHPGSIQLSQSTYELLRERYVFRRRGGYYVEQLGEISTFTVGGRG